MLRKLLVVFFSVFSFAASAQNDSTGVRISLLTCGTGPEVWETFGHTAIRVTDSLMGTDDVYNYGTFNGFDKDFELNFMRGKLLYYLSFYPYQAFMDEYRHAGRSVREQALLFDPKRKEDFYNFLRRNADEQHKYYKYDFFFDNCATRIRDAFPKTYGDNFRFADVLPSNSKLTFRNIINQYFYADHFVRFGVNILLGSKIDRVMTNEDIMFLPDYLEQGIAGADINGRKIAAPSVLLLPQTTIVTAPFNWVLFANIALLIMIVLGFSVKPLHRLGWFLGNLLLFASGLVGCLILVMWLATDHQGCANNFNLLWALPTNIIIAFMPKHNKGRYAIVAIACLLASFMLHLLRIQEMLLPEMLPVLLALLFTYGMIYRRTRIN